MKNLRIVLAGDPSEYTIRADDWEIIKNGILHTFCRSGAGRTYDHQYFNLRHVLMWAFIS